MHTKYTIFGWCLLLLTGCKEETNYDTIYYDQVRKIKITNNISVDNVARLKDPNLNLINYNNFLKYLVSSDRFLIVTQRDFEKTNSSEKVIISLRYDVDDEINNAIKFAFLENKYGIRSTYYILHTADYYGKTSFNYVRRNESVKFYLQKIQNEFHQEIGWHNDLVTLQVVYNIDSKNYLHAELEWLRKNSIQVFGTAAHGSNYCYEYHYKNHYFWNHHKCNKNDFFYNYEYVPKGKTLMLIQKDELNSYNLEYDGDTFLTDYFFADCNLVDGKRWHMGMVNFDTIPLGKKVIILLHPQHWN